MKRRLNLEALEDRCLLSAVIVESAFIVDHQSFDLVNANRLLPDRQPGDTVLAIESVAHSTGKQPPTPLGGKWQFITGINYGGYTTNSSTPDNNSLTIWDQTVLSTGNTSAWDFMSAGRAFFSVELILIRSTTGQPLSISSSSIDSSDLEPFGTPPTAQSVPANPGDLVIAAFSTTPYPVYTPVDMSRVDNVISQHGYTNLLIPQKYADASGSTGNETITEVGAIPPMDWAAGLVVIGDGGSISIGP